MFISKINIFIKDHLGNARVNYTKNSEGVLEITNSNNYYPFGLNHIGGGKGLLGGYRNYKYNGKELQETGMYDYGARFYMPDIGRWGVIDPRSQYTHETYSYVWNNSILFNDPTGMEGETGKCPPNCPNGVSAINISPNGQKETTIQEIILTGKAADNSSGPGSLAMAALIVSQADSPAPGPADIVAAGMLIGAGVWWTYNQFAPPSTGYTTIADPGAGYRNLKTEDTAEEDKDVNGQEVPNDSISGNDNRRGGGKNGAHKNWKAKLSAQEEYEKALADYNKLKSKPNKTPQDKKDLKKAETQKNHWKKKADETGENHSQKAKGSN